MFPLRFPIWIKLLFAFMLVLPASTAFGTGATMEEEELGDRFNGRFPVVISGDGKWVLHIDAKQVLHRTATGNADIDQTMQLPMPVRALATTQSGDKAAFQGELTPECVGVMSFSDSGKASRIRWQNTSPVAESATESCGVAWSNVGGDAHGDKIFDPYALALSADGKSLAASVQRPFPYVAVIDLDSGKPIFNIPTGARALELRFVDHDHKLFVAQAVLGEGEDGPSRSDVQFVVWDLQKKELFNFYRTANDDGLRPIDFLWDFSEQTGEVLGFRSGAKFTLPEPAQPDQSRSAHTVAANMKHCSLMRDASLMHRFEHAVSDIVADPAGRWVALVTDEVDEKNRLGHTALVLIEQGFGKELTRWPLDERLGAFTVSPDGLHIYASSFGTVRLDKGEHADNSSSFWNMRGGGQLRRFDLGAFVKQTSLDQTVAWSARGCTLEDELQGARDIAVSNKLQVQKFAVALSDLRQRVLSGANDKSSCLSDNSNASFFYSKALKNWGRADNDSIWVDRWEKLEQINPATGSVMRAIATPRSKAACSLPLYDRRQFLSWQGDTISLRPFAEGTKLGERKVLASKPGWTVEGIEMLGERIGVRWVDNRFRGRDSPLKGSALATVYDLNGRKIEETTGTVGGGLGIYAEDGFNFTLFADKKVRRDSGDYHWSTSYFNSIRAQHTNDKGQAGKAVMWAGLTIDAAPLLWVDMLLDAGTSRAVKIGPEQVQLFDAANRQRVAQIEVKANNAEWDKTDHLLLLEVRGDDAHQPTSLQAYRIDD